MTFKPSCRFISKIMIFSSRPDRSLSTLKFEAFKLKNCNELSLLQAVKTTTKHKKCMNTRRFTTSVNCDNIYYFPIPLSIFKKIILSMKKNNGTGKIFWDTLLNYLQSLFARSYSQWLLQYSPSPEGSRSLWLFFPTFSPLLPPPTNLVPHNLWGGVT